MQCRVLSAGILLIIFSIYIYKIQAFSFCFSLVMILSGFGVRVNTDFVECARTFYFLEQFVKNFINSKLNICL